MLSIDHGHLSIMVTELIQLCFPKWQPWVTHGLCYFQFVLFSVCVCEYACVSMSINKPYVGTIGVVGIYSLSWSIEVTVS